MQKSDDKMKFRYGVQILDETDYVSHGTNTFGRGMILIIHPPAMSK